MPFPTARINRIGGFPHSEIVGSMLAHSSPTLIAACHVLHRLYMPRHPRIALTSRLRVHTTNDNTGSVLRPTRNSAEQRAWLSWVWLKILSLCCDGSRHVRTNDPKIASASTPTPHGIDLKNPFTMSKIGRAPITLRLPMSTMGNSFASSIGEGVLVAREPVSRSKAAPCGCASLRWPFSLALEMVEPIGIEPMT